MPDTSLLKPYNATCGGGLVLNKDVYDMAPGEALQLVNFEPSTEGGYRRLNGTTKSLILIIRFKKTVSSDS